MEITQDKKIELREKFEKILSADKDNKRKIDAIFEVLEAKEETETEEPLDKPVAE